MSRGVHLPVAAQPTLEGLLELFELTESSGYDVAYLPETWGRDAVSVLALATTRTEEIDLGSSILNVYSRSPALIGQTAATLQEASDGRFRLGLGPSGPAVIEHWHGESFDRPLRRTREYVEVVRAVLGGEPVEYDGNCVQVSGFRLRADPPATPPPIEVAGMGPKAVELAGRYADGWHALLFTPDGLRERLTDLHRGCSLGDRASSDVRTTLSLTCCVLPDGDRARDLVRQHLAFYVGGMGTFYRDQLIRQGFEELANDVFTAWQSGNREDAVARIDDATLESLAVAGTPTEARAQLDTFEAIEGLDTVAVSFPRGADRRTIETTLAELAPDASSE